MSYKKEYYEQHKGKFAESGRKWRAKNPNYGHDWYMANRESQIESGRQWRLDNPDRMDFLNKRNYAANGESIRASVKEWRMANPEKVSARNRVAQDIKNGNVVRPDNCSSCGVAGVIDGHHPDYSKSLDITWLCRSCHKREHSMILVH